MEKIFDGMREKLKILKRCIDNLEALSKKELEEKIYNIVCSVDNLEREWKLQIYKLALYKNDQFLSIDSISSNTTTGVENLEYEEEKMAVLDWLKKIEGEIYSCKYYDISDDIFLYQSCEYEAKMLNDMETLLSVKELTSEFSKEFNGLFNRCRKLMKKAGFTRK